MGKKRATFLGFLGCLLGGKNPKPRGHTVTKRPFGFRALASRPRSQPAASWPAKICAAKMGLGDGLNYGALDLQQNPIFRCETRSLSIVWEGINLLNFSAKCLNGKEIYKWERTQILDDIHVMSKICDPFPFS